MSGAIGIKDFGPPKHHGVVALRKIPKAATIERVPVLIIHEKDREFVDLTNLFHYLFAWEKGEREDSLYKHEGRAALALGLCTLLNHSDSPNAVFVKDFEAGEIEIIASKDIEAGEEITINYDMKLWFRVI